MSTETRDGAWGEALDDPVLADLLAELRELADQPAPPIGPELRAVLRGAHPLTATPLTAARSRRRRTASAVVIGLVSSGVLAGGITAAAADELPAPVQRVVARVVNAVTPFEIPDRGLREQPDRDPSERTDPSGPTEPREHATLPRDLTPSAPASNPATHGTEAVDDAYDTDEPTGTREDQTGGDSSGEDSSGTSDEQIIEEHDDSREGSGERSGEGSGEVDGDDEGGSDDQGDGGDGGEDRERSEG